jgi:hypothetical protein
MLYRLTSDTYSVAGFGNEIVSSGGRIMHIRTTMDPITLHEVANPEEHPCVYEGDGENGLEIYFENEENKQEYLAMEMADFKIIQGNDTDDYVAEG